MVQISDALNSLAVRVPYEISSVGVSALLKSDFWILDVWILDLRIFGFWIYPPAYAPSGARTPVPAYTPSGAWGVVPRRVCVCVCVCVGGGTAARG